MRLTGCWVLLMNVIFENSWAPHPEFESRTYSAAGSLITTRPLAAWAVLPWPCQTISAFWKVGLPFRLLEPLLITAINGQGQVWTDKALCQSVNVRKTPNPSHRSHKFRMGSLTVYQSALDWLATSIVKEQRTQKLHLNYIYNAYTNTPLA